MTSRTRAHSGSFSHTRKHAGPTLSPLDAADESEAHTAEQHDHRRDEPWQHRGARVKRGAYHWAHRPTSVGSDLTKGEHRAQVARVGQLAEQRIDHRVHERKAADVGTNACAKQRQAHAVGGAVAWGDRQHGHSTEAHGDAADQAGSNEAEVPDNGHHNKELRDDQPHAERHHHDRVLGAPPAKGRLEEGRRDRVGAVRKVDERDGGDRQCHRGSHEGSSLISWCHSLDTLLLRSEVVRKGRFVALSCCEHNAGWRECEPYGGGGGEAEEHPDKEWERRAHFEQEGTDGWAKHAGHAVHDRRLRKEGRQGLCFCHLRRVRARQQWDAAEEAGDGASGEELRPCARQRAAQSAEGRTEKTGDDDWFPADAI
eukprot:4502728-Prymnesium_polylepis.1